MINLKSKQKILNENFLTGAVPSYLSPINPRKKISNGVLQMTVEPSIQETEYLRSNILFDQNFVKISFNDTWIDLFDEVTGYIGLDSENGDYWRFQFSDSGSTNQMIRIYAYKNSISTSFDIGSSPLSKEKPMDFSIEYNKQEKYLDFFAESSRYRITDPSFLPDNPLYPYMYIRTRDNKAKTLGIGSYKIELE